MELLILNKALLNDNKKDSQKLFASIFNNWTTDHKHHQVRLIFEILSIADKPAISILDHETVGPNSQLASSMFEDHVQDFGPSIT